MPDTPPFSLTQHAALVTGRRRIDPALRHAFRPIPQFEHRVLRVVYNPSMTPPLVITAYFDRSRRGTL